MYQICCEATVDGELHALWTTWTDMTSYPDWDRREELVRLDGPFQVGTTGFSKQAGRRPGGTFRLTRVQPTSEWTNETPLPGGKLVLIHQLAPAGPGRVQLTKIYQVYGPLSVLFRLHYGREIKRNIPTMFAALAVEAARRTAVV
jgi:hypothetical protein